MGAACPICGVAVQNDEQLVVRRVVLHHELQAFRVGRPFRQSVVIVMLQCVRGIWSIGRARPSDEIENWTPFVDALVKPPAFTNRLKFQFGRAMVAM